MLKIMSKKEFQLLIKEAELRGRKAGQRETEAMLKAAIHQNAELTLKLQHVEKMQVIKKRFKTFLN